MYGRRKYQPNEVVDILLSQETIAPISSAQCEGGTSWWNKQ